MKNLLFIPLVFMSLFINSASGKSYKGAEYRTKDAFTYGRFETRMKPAGKEGMLASFFTYHEITTTSDWNEIDIEILGRYTNDVQFNPITKGQVNHVHHSLTAFNPALDYHDYGFEWTPDYVAWFIDGVEVHRQTGDHIKSLDLDQKIMMNVWNPDYANWVGQFTDKVLPAYSYYDWVKYSAYTPGTGNYGTDNNFTVLWKDEFDAFDSTRWEKAVHTFGGNNCDFVKENVIFQNGKMILALTDNVTLGLNDTKGPALLWARGEKNKVTLYLSEEVNALNSGNKANYTIPGASVLSAKLLDDFRTVVLTTSDLNMASTYNVITLNQKDIFGNTSSPQAITMHNVAPLQFPLKVNIGGEAVSGFLADQDFTENVEYGCVSGDVKKYPLDLVVSNSEGDSVYLSDRNDFPTFRARVPNGIYKVTMMFAENVFTLPGKRLFDVIVENKMIENNLDLFAKAGANAAYKITVTTEVNDEMLDLYFQSEVGTNVLSGVIVEQVSTDLKQVGALNPDKYYLEQNYPNPFNPATTIAFGVPSASFVSVSLYNTLGEMVMKNDLGCKANGCYTFTLNLRDDPSGVYFYALRAESTDGSKKFTDVKKLVLLK